MDGLTLIVIMITFYDDIRYPHLNPAITLSSCLTLDTKIILGLGLIFVQFFGAFFGALLTRAVMKSSAFINTFVSLGLLTRNLEFRPEDDSEVFANRFQMFLMETILTFMLTFSHTMISQENQEIYLPINVGVARAITAYIGLHSFSQSVNLARMLANNIIAAIFALDDHVWRFFYIFVFAAIVGPVFSAGFFWLLRYSRMDRAHERTTIEN
uniref:Uncharacterized protein n=1 Tax=Acrobeloides nanus TaxID=290746 RepID=A0A914CEX0_9BILA